MTIIDHEYTGPTPIKKDDHVIVIDEDGKERTAKVRLLMASQFLARVHNQGDVFRFYTDIGETWKLEDEDEDVHNQE